MAIRRDTSNRLALIRMCGTCGRTFPTTASSPWMRQVPRNGKRQATTYYCSSTCYQASYKHIGWYDGKAEERRKQRESGRDPAKRAKAWKRYYQENGDKIRKKRIQINCLKIIQPIKSIT